MGGEEEPCKLARVLVEVSEPERGGAPGFTPYHVLEALKLLSRKSMGRPALQRALGLGEGSVKTMVAKLREKGMVERVGKGLKVTSAGARVAEVLTAILTYTIFKEEVPGLWEEDTLITCLSCAPAPRNLTEVYKVRDYLVAEGCRVSLVGGAVGPGYYVLPGVPDYIGRHVVDVLDAIRARGLVVLTPASCTPQTVSAILKLLAFECPCKPPG
ncbi:MAG: hypothetical protein F7B17_00590 [Desulfurococcales archaeon]|nr:hypothetical protein [Desulfurococcales archaeon]